MAKPFFFVLAILLCVLKTSAQGLSSHEQIQRTVDLFVEGLNNNDTLVIRKVIDPNLGLLTVFHDGKKNILAAETVDMMMESIAKPKTKLYREEQDQCIIETNNVLASVWCKYVFYEENKILHCGINAYQLYKTKKGWKIIQITDSRQSFNCAPLTLD
jgi:tricorn protease-like protein